MENLNLNVMRAKETWQEDLQTEREYLATKEEFSKTKFVYLELATKSEFVKEILAGTEVDADTIDKAEENLAESKSSCKKIKNKCKAMKDEINQILVQTLQKQSELEANAAELEALKNGQRDEENQSLEEKEKLEAKITEKQSVLAQQEDDMRELGQKKQELEIRVRNLEQEAESLAADVKHSPVDIHNSRIASWYNSANSLLNSLSGVKQVSMQENAILIEFEVQAFHRSDKKLYSMTVVLNPSATLAYELRLEPPDIDASDLENAYLIEFPPSFPTRHRYFFDSSLSLQCPDGNLAKLFQEVKNRLACRLALESELDTLRNKFSIEIAEEGSLLVVCVSPLASRNLARSPAKALPKWQCEISIEADYPRPHILPELVQVRSGAFASPGMKRERAIMEVVNRTGHRTVAAMVADASARLGL
ncbi:hypothetical protein GUITHDRAFT_139774 [Guillardia theta CCMP2712]|uniref:Kinetochore protein Sos7 coiled-coil domain-containing protein n=1 Tax=Guillardia theta (strain CCMP2712) TaxID=905079 RepID=L1J7M8_GUITC|nr:hypothetical protein GUITHDRAFT_139774 [Guillardia theta CCMP2712]EKX44548.1 hypothetical protein GUITHDRAFT_139774 [Guillardia theta CCMP2712]|eukprot:XP_005831528.1 hypothetical protein GUITHDRAFT_139774 [Guillardia theta CCMP2712]